MEELRLGVILLWATVVGLFCPVVVLSWPSGSYCLPAPRGGNCPGGAEWSKGWRRWDTENENPLSHSCGAVPSGEGTAAPVNDARQYVSLSFCCRAGAGGSGPWPAAGGRSSSYCVFRSPIDECPSGFLEGWREWSDEKDFNRCGVNGRDFCLFCRVTCGLQECVL